MLFNSIEFLIFFPIVVLVYFLIPQRARYLWLLAASYYFYMCWNAKYALLLLASTVITWTSGCLMERIRKKTEDVVLCKKRMRFCLAGSFTLNLGVLFYFKYFNFAISSINRILEFNSGAGVIPLRDIILPVGISFFTLQALGYTVDVYRGEIKAEHNFFRYALFVSFFPQLVAGPIERSKNLLKQMQEEHHFKYENFREGVYLMLWGYFLKIVLADRIAIFVDKVYGDIVQFGGVYLIVASMLFAFQIYCDFAGYSTIAKGAAQIMGFELMENFDAPYFARSVAEFWRRWHISLSSWFRDYLYIPLGGNRKGTARKYLNLLIVFGISGLWHGAEWTFVIWGLLNAVYQVIGQMLSGVKKHVAERLHLHKETFGGKIMSILITFVLVDFAWIFFRAENLAQAVEVIRSILTQHNAWVLFDDSITSLVITRKNFEIMILSLGVLFVADLLKYREICVREVIMRQDLWFRCLVVAGSILFILTFGIWGPGYDAAGFIYFQF